MIVFVYYMLIVDRNSTKYIYAPGVAAMYFIASMFQLEKTGSSLNPARVFGLCMMNNYYYQIFGSFFGCLMGALLGSLLGSLLIESNPKTQ